MLTYAWTSVGDEMGNGLRSSVTWRLTAIPNGTRTLRKNPSAPEPSDGVAEILAAKR